MSDQDIIDTIAENIVGGVGDWREVDARSVLAALRERYAIVELPEPDDPEPDGDGQVYFGDYDVRADPTGSRQGRQVVTGFGLGSEVRRSMTPAAARHWAGLLLAAAAAAEADQ
ncbi:MAG: hypothetical protein K0U84_01725 [Actinomycetia bacterium]|nr:hypothetical protein [Actinomycetes bacterium]